MVRQSWRLVAFRLCSKCASYFGGFCSFAVWGGTLQFSPLMDDLWSVLYISFLTLIIHGHGCSFSASLQFAPRNLHWEVHDFDTWPFTIFFWCDFPRDFFSNHLVVFCSVQLVYWLSCSGCVCTQAYKPSLHTWICARTHTHLPSYRNKLNLYHIKNFFWK